MIQVKQSEWDKISPEYKGQWTQELADWRGDIPADRVGKRTVCSGCISDELGSLLTEGCSFEIVPDDAILSGVQKGDISMNELIKQTGMKLEPLAKLLGIPHDTLLSYSSGRRPMPNAVEKELKKLIARVKG